MGLVFLVALSLGCFSNGGQLKPISVERMACLNKSLVCPALITTAVSERMLEGVEIRRQLRNDDCSLILFVCM